MNQAELDKGIDEIIMRTNKYQKKTEYIYFLTIDKVKLDIKPTKQYLIEVRNKICKEINARPIKPYQVHCFEHKGMGNNRRLHYHCLVSSFRSYIPYKECLIKNHSIKLVKMKSYYDIARTAGYIQKYKQDRCDCEEFMKFHRLI